MLLDKGVDEYLKNDVIASEAGKVLIEHGGHKTIRDVQPW